MINFYYPKVKIKSMAAIKPRKTMLTLPLRGLSNHVYY